jgi:hypothetical protein
MGAVMQLSGITTVQWAILRVQWATLSESGNMLLCAVVPVRLNIQGLTLGLYSNLLYSNLQ